MDIFYTEKNFSSQQFNKKSRRGKSFFFRLLKMEFSVVEWDNKGKSSVS